MLGRNHSVQRSCGRELIAPGHRFSPWAAPGSVSLKALTSSGAKIGFPDASRGVARVRLRLFPLLATALLGVAAAARAAKGEAISFEQDVRPILKTHCFRCHGEMEKPKGGVDLRLRRFMLHQTDDGPVMVPGKPEQSLMFKLARSGEMPKADKKVPPADLAVIEKWIRAGARTARPEPEQSPHGFYLTAEDREFWSFQPIRRPAPPKLKNAARARTPVDAFVLEKLHEQKLDFAPDADKLALVRRVYLDLTGLPPTPEVVEAFARDESPDAYDKLVDRALDSPAYGERWGRHWLDVAGYADSNGFAEADSVRPHAWRYRDYVIRSFNEDKPWNRFITEQLAGDELAGVTQANAVAKARDPRARELLEATGFLRLAPDGTGDDVPDQNLARNQVIAETIKIVSSSLLGLTVGCAQCHDHRYDPISHADYHRLRALFEPALDWKRWQAPAQRLVSLYSDDDRKKAEAIEADARKLDEPAEKLRKEFLEQVFEREIKKVPEAEREAVKIARNTSGDKRTEAQKQLLRVYPAADVQGALDLYDPALNKKYLEEKGKADKLRGTKPPEPFVMALLERPEKPPDTFLFYRGDHEQPRQKIEPGEIEVLRAAGAPVADFAAFTAEVKATNALASSGRRLAYAEWLTSGRHPLVARVLVNRFWMHHFGRGLVNTPGDFGRLGERPTHPELLDWLAAEFMANGWRLKPLHRLLMTSTVYRQSARNDASLKADPDNRYYARWKLRRLEAEEVRDSLLTLSGKLNPAPFGAPVAIARDDAGRVVAGAQKLDGNGDPVGVDPLGAAEYRRSVYLQVRRSLPVTALDVFYFPAAAPNCDARAVTTVAPQALMLLNDSFVVTASQQLAERLRQERPGDLRGQISRLWTLLYGAAPSDRETRDALIYLAEQSESIRARQPATPPAAKDKPVAAPDLQLDTLASLCQVLYSANRFLYIE